MATTVGAGTRQAAGGQRRRSRGRGGRRPNWLGGAAGWLWLLIVIVPIYWIVITSFKTQSNYFQTNPFAPPTEPTLDNYRMVIENDFIRYFVNSAIVTLGAVVPAVLVSFMAAYAIVRAAGDRRLLRWVNSLFLMGLAIPLQAAIIPVYLIVIRLHMYDTLLAIILPSIAFAIPLSVLVLANFIRDVPKELFDSMRVDGASEWSTLRHLAFPLTRPALVTVSIYSGLADLERVPPAADPHPEPEPAHPAAGVVDVPGPVQRQRARRPRVRRPHSPADPRPLRPRAPPAPQRVDRGIQQVR